MGIELEKQRAASRERKKKLVEKWYQERAASAEPTSANRREKKEGIHAEKRAQLEERIRNKPKNERQREAEHKVSRINDAIEERPPLPPKPHDLPKPVLDMVSDSSRTAKSQSARPVSWTV